MITDDFSALILQNFPHLPTKEQADVVADWASFILSRRNDEAFLLRGFAGTGKTSLVGALVKTLSELRQPVELLAPTGRAAKVFSLYAGRPAYTIHRRIYRQKSITEMDNFQANVNLHRNTLFIVDEASMIANDGLSGAMFGTGRLLDDLIQFVYSAEGCRLLLIGDTAQLPPVGEYLSQALEANALAGYGLNVHEATLTQVVRQTEDSGILWNATALRERISIEDVFELPRIRVSCFPDIKVIAGNELIEALEQSYYRCGKEETIVITRSNKRANIYNNGIRARILDCEEALSNGDQILIVKNNYYFKLDVEDEDDHAHNGQSQREDRRKENDSFIANGDIAVVRRVRNEREFYGLHFADVVVTFPDYNDAELDAVVIMDTLQSDAPALTKQQQEQLFQGVWDDYPELTNKRDRMKRLREDPYYNALQIKHAYAVTCHKAQGGQWEHVYIDQGYMTDEMLGPDYFRWLYTAITRATDTVFLVNWPETQIDASFG